MSGRSISWGRLVVLMASVGLVVAGVIVALNRNDHANATIPAPPASSTTVATASSGTPPDLASNSVTTSSSGALEIPTSRVATPGLPASQSCHGLPSGMPNEKQLCDKLQGFVKAYYSRKAGDTVGVIKERLAPYVPESLLANMYIPTEYGDITSAYLSKFKDGDLDAISFNLDGNNMSANAIGPDHHVTVNMPIILVLSKPDGSLLSQFAFPAQAWPSTDWIFNGQWEMTRFTP